MFSESGFIPGSGDTVMNVRLAFPLLNVELGGCPVPSADLRPGRVGAAEKPFVTVQWVPRAAACSSPYFQSLPLSPIVQPLTYYLQVYNYHHLCKLLPYMLNYLITITARETCVRFALLPVSI